MECSCRLWPTPGMYAVTSMPLVRRTRATLRSAEFGFLGVVVYTRVHTPRRWGLPLSAGVLVLPTLSARPLRTSCWIVGTESPCSLVLFSASFLSSSLACLVVLGGAGSRPPPALGRVADPPSGPGPSQTSAGRSAAPGPVRPACREPAPPWRAERPGEPQARRKKIPGPCSERQNGRSDRVRAWRGGGGAAGGRARGGGGRAPRLPAHLS